MMIFSKLDREVRQCNYQVNFYYTSKYNLTECKIKLMVFSCLCINFADKYLVQYNM